MGTNYIAPTWRQPENTNKDKLSNYSIDFDAADSELIDVNYTPPATWFNNGFSISAWVYPLSPNNDTIIGAYSTNRFYWRLYDTDKWWVGFGNWNDATIVNSVTSNEWQHVVLTYTSSDTTIRFYRNGTLDGSIVKDLTGLSMPNSAYPLTIGVTNQSSNAGYFDGSISQVCLFDYTISTDQINYLSNSGTPQNPMAISGAKPIAYWPLGDNSNPTALAGYPNISVGAGSAFQIPGGNTFPNTITFGTKNSEELKITDKITISIWIKTTDNNVSSSPLEPFLTRNQYAEGWLIGKRWETTTSDGFLRMWFYNADGTNNVLDADGNWNDIANGEWHHIAYTYNGTSNAGGLKVYVDGQPSNSMATASTGIKDSTGSNWDTLILGMRQYTYETIDGEYSNLSIFNTDLEATGTQSIESLYANGIPPEISNYNNLVGWWKLDQSANWEADSAGEWQIPDALSAYPQSFSFNGVDDQINLGLESDLDIGGASKYSTSLWFKKVSNGTNCFWGYNYGDPSGSGFYLWQSSGAFRVAVGNNSLTTGFGYYNIVSANVPIGEWINVVVVFDGTLASGNDRIKVYQNGELATGTYVNGSNFPATLPNGNGASNRNVYLGQLQLANGSFSYSFDGKMSNVMQWTTDLSLSDATAIYNNGVPLPTASVQASSLKAWYKLDNTAIFYPTQQYWGIPNAASTSNILNFSN